MTAKQTQLPAVNPLPDPPEHEPDDMTSVQQLGENGNLHHLVQHLSNPDTTIVSGERYIVPAPATPASESSPTCSSRSTPTGRSTAKTTATSSRARASRPTLVMEIASRRTGRTDVLDKPARYAALGIPEYWRFDETGEFHGVRLAGDRLVQGRYEPIPIEEIEDGVLQGYGAALDLFVRWERGELRWHDPATGRPISTFEDQKARADEERAAANEERARANAAEARLQELEAELAQRNQQG